MNWLVSLLGTGKRLLARAWVNPKTPHHKVYTQHNDGFLFL